MEKIVIRSSQVAISPQKMNLVADLIRRKSLDYSLRVLSFLPKKGGRIIHKLLQGAAKNLSKNQEEINNFYLSRIEVNRGRIQKKLICRARGRADRLKKRYCLINLYLTKQENN
jgi:large subunit ribosomal protein L22